MNRSVHDVIEEDRPIDAYAYLLLLAGCLAITLPLEFVLAARVYRRPVRLLRALLPVVVLYAIWDVVGIARGHWWYNERFVTGIHLPFDMPLEELCFFVVVPICGLLTWEAVGHVLAWVRAWRAGGAPTLRARIRASWRGLDPEADHTPEAARA